MSEDDWRAKLTDEDHAFLAECDRERDAWFQKGLDAGWLWTKEPVEIRPDMAKGAKPGLIDEIVAHNADIHVEQMSATDFWLGINKNGRLWMFHFTSKATIKLTGGED